MGPTSLMVHAVRVLGRAEHDQDDELFLDVVEPVLDVGADEDRGARLDDLVLGADLDLRPTGDHVVDLVLGVRALWIRAARGQHVQADGQVMGPNELVVEAARPGARAQQVGEIEGLHGSGD